MPESGNLQEFSFNIPVPSFRINLDGTFLNINPAFRHLLQIPEEEELSSVLISQFIRGDKGGQDWLAQVLSESLGRSIELQVMNWNNETIWIQSYTFVEKNQAGKAFSVSGSWVDITGKRHASQETHRLLEVIKQAPISLVLTDLKGNIYYVNTHFSKVSGFRSDEVLGKKPSFLKSGMHEPDFYTKLWEDLSNGKVWNGTFINKRKNGSLFYEDATVFPLQDNRGNSVGYAAVKLDITEQYKMQRELIKTGEVLSSIFDNMQEGIVRLTLDGKIDMINKALCLELGLNPDNTYKGEIIDDLAVKHPINFQEIIDKIAIDREIQHFLVEDYPRFYRINGRLLQNEVQAPHFIISIENVSDEKILERQLIETQKIEALGQIAEGIAHDFNNVLSNIYSSVYLLENDLKNVNVGELLKVIGNGVQRGKNITERMLTFVGTDEPQKQNISIIKVLDDLAYLVQHSLPKNIHFRYASPPKEYYLDADSQHMSQMFLNVILNGSDAMPLGGIVDLEIIDPVEKNMYMGPPDKDPEDYLLFLIKDSGAGIEKNVLNHIFDPFFTTKPVGKGSGLGLPVVKKIVKNHQGWIDIESQPGFGTSVYIGLPLASAPPESSSQKVEVAEKDIKNKTYRNSRLLLVEDELELLELLKYVFKELELQIDTAENGRLAIELFSKNPDSYDLILADLGLPDYRGATVIEKILAIKPEQKIMVMTGYLSETINTELQDFGIDQIIRKPFEISELLNTVASNLKPDKKRFKKQD